MGSVPWQLRSPSNAAVCLPSVFLVPSSPLRRAVRAEMEITKARQMGIHSKKTQLRIPRGVGYARAIFNFPKYMYHSFLATALWPGESLSATFPRGHCRSLSLLDIGSMVWSNLNHRKERWHDDTMARIDMTSPSNIQPPARSTSVSLHYRSTPRTLIYV